MTTTTDTWKYILINGKSSTIEVKNPTYDKGKLQTIEEVRPIKNTDADGKPIAITTDFVESAKRAAYIEFFKKPFKNLLILSGAGSSMDTGGKSMWQLWNIAERKFGFEENKTEITDSHFKVLCNDIAFDYTSKNLETLLSQIEGVIKFRGDIEITYKKEKLKLSEIKKIIFNTIRQECTITAPSPTDNFPHKTFLDKVLQRKPTSPRVKVFTLNYDTLFEAAAQRVNAVVIDGFSFTVPRTFSGRLFDYDIVQREGSKLKEEDNFIQRVFHLHKLHGSVTWTREFVDGHVIVDANTKDPLMVYPREAKYEDSYEQPFFEMMARFQRNLRLNNDTLLICIGYSFNDKHINSAIEEALNQNPGFRLAVIDPGIDSGNSQPMENIKKSALNSSRILMVAETFSDFAESYPEIQTYDEGLAEVITLNTKA